MLPCKYATIISQRMDTIEVCNIHKAGTLKRIQSDKKHSKPAEDKYNPSPVFLIMQKALNVHENK